MQPFSLTTVSHASSSPLRAVFPRAFLLTSCTRPSVPSDSDWMKIPVNFLGQLVGTT